VASLKVMCIKICFCCEILRYFAFIYGASGAEYGGGVGVVWCDLEGGLEGFWRGCRGGEWVDSGAENGLILGVRGGMLCK